MFCIFPIRCWNLFMMISNSQKSIYIYIISNFHSIRFYFKRNWTKYDIVIWYLKEMSYNILASKLQVHKLKGLKVHHISYNLITFCTQIIFGASNGSFNWKKTTFCCRLIMIRYHYWKKNGFRLARLILITKLVLSDWASRWHRIVIETNL